MRVLLAAGGMHPEPGGVPLVSGRSGLSAGAAAAALRSGWLAARPDDEVTALPVPDGGPGSAPALPAARIRSRTVLHGAGPLGDIREVDLVGLGEAPGPAESAGRAGPAEG
ncbi:glycerate kinase, partial [Actinomyces dentalis]|uniref:glycerate kinase n=1 Tax=Actinomyces dentalis TaxID=272548 RepID=UPI0028E486B2